MWKNGNSGIEYFIVMNIIAWNMNIVHTSKRTHTYIHTFIHTYIHICIHNKYEDIEYAFLFVPVGLKTKDD